MEFHVSFIQLHSLALLLTTVIAIPKDNVQLPPWQNARECKVASDDCPENSYCDVTRQCACRFEVAAEDPLACCRVCPCDAVCCKGNLTSLGCLPGDCFICPLLSSTGACGGDNCGGVVDLTQVGAMTITATDSDDDGIYDDDLDCWWAFTVDEGTIEFESNFFNIELQSSCNWDWVQLLDGSGEYLGGQAKYCGTTIGSSFQTTSRSLYIWFHTDFCCVTGGPPTGFNFTVKAVLP